MTICRHWHRQSNAPLQQSYQRPRLNNTIIDLGGQRNNDSPIDNDLDDLRCQIPNKDRLDVATQNRLMMVMQLNNPVKWIPKEREGLERMASERE